MSSYLSHKRKGFQGAAPAAFDGFGNRSRSFDGVDDYIDLGDSDDFSFGDGSNDSPFSISAWIKPNAHSFRILTKYNNDTNTREYTFTIDSSNRLIAFLYDQSNSSTIVRRCSSNLMSNYFGQWVHVVMTYDGSSTHAGLKCFINKVREDDLSTGSGSYVSMENTNESAKIGVNGSTAYSNGKKADVRLYNSELSTTDILNLYNGTNITTNLVGHWLTDADNLLDASGSNNGTNYGTKYSYDNPSPPVEFGSASRSFDGVDDYVNLGDALDNVFAGTGKKFTITAWIKTTTLADTHPIAKYSTSGERAFLIRVLSDGNLGVVMSNDGNFNNVWGRKTANAPISENTWHHISITYDQTATGDYLRMWVDGVEDPTLTDWLSGGTFTSIYDATTELRISGTTQNAGMWEGKIADVRIYDADLTASQISDLYAGTDVSTNLAGHWLTDNDDVEDKAGTNDGTNFGSVYSDDNPPMDLIPFGKKSRSFSSGYINTNTGFQSVFQSSFSISTWVRFQDGTPPSSNVIFGNQSAAPINRTLIFLDNAGALTFGYFSNGIQARAEIDQNFSNGDTGWFHYTAVVQPTGITIYKDGLVQTLDATDDGDMSALTMGDYGTDIDCYIGARNNNGTTDLSMSGNLADFRIYDSALSASDAAKIYNRTDDKSNIYAWYLTNSDDVLDHAGTNDGTNNGSTYSTDSPS